MTQLHDMQPHFDTHPDTGGKMVAGYVCSHCDLEAGHLHGHVDYLKTQPCNPPPPTLWQRFHEYLYLWPLALAFGVMAGLLFVACYMIINADKIEAELRAVEIADCKVLLHE